MTLGVRGGEVLWYRTTDKCLRKSLKPFLKQGTVGVGLPNKIQDIQLDLNFR